MGKLERFKGALHVHTNLSHDGLLSVEELRNLFSSHGFKFVCLCDHSQDVSSEKWNEIMRLSEENSDREFVFIPGLEYTCHDEIHIMGIGLSSLITETEPGIVVDAIREQGGIAILSHPTKKDYDFDSNWIRRLDGAEIWNLAYDGKFLPQIKSIRKFNEFRLANPKLMAFFGLDLHQRGGFFDHYFDVESVALSPSEIVSSMKSGKFSCKSGAFHIEPHSDFTTFEKNLIRVGNTILNPIRQARRVYDGT
jgi:predicted metal-dependent phosphoesterase TrpH